MPAPRARVAAHAKSQIQNTLLILQTVASSAPATRLFAILFTHQASAFLKKGSALVLQLSAVHLLAQLTK
jgi:hypothetical protein